MVRLAKVKAGDVVELKDIPAAFELSRRNIAKIRTTVARGGRTDEKAGDSLRRSGRIQGPEIDQGSTGKVRCMRKTQESAART